MAIHLVVGLGQFGRGVVEQLHELGEEVAVLDADRLKVEAVRDRCAMSAVVDVNNLDALERLIPEGVQSVVIDCGGKENPFLNVLLANYYHNKMIPRIFALAYSRQHAEILRLTGAHEAIEPERETAARVARALSRPGFASYLPFSEDFAVAEIAARQDFQGKTLREIELRARFGVQAVAVKRVYQGKESYRFAEPGEIVQEGDMLVVVGPEKKILKLV